MSTGNEQNPQDRPWGLEDQLDLDRIWTRQKDLWQTSQRCRLCAHFLEKLAVLLLEESKRDAALSRERPFSGLFCNTPNIRGHNRHSLNNNILTVTHLQAL